MRMEITIQKAILCAITDDPQKVQGLPVFMGESAEARQKKALYLGRILQGVIHDLGDDVLIVVKH
jgi:hypothetical protein